MTDKPIILSKYTQEELQSLQHEISIEIERRTNEEQNKVWRAVVKAIEDYNNKYGEIIIYDNDGREVFLDNRMWASSNFGEISVY